MKFFVRAMILILGLSASLLAQAVIETYQFSEPALELRYRQLSTELRCPKCQNQNIADSNAPIAKDLRRLLHQQLEAGASNEEILDHMVSRYGEFVRYRPRFGGVTLWLWLVPGLLFAAALLVVLMSIGRRRSKVGDAEVTLSDEEQARLDQLLAKTEKRS